MSLRVVVLWSVPLVVALGALPGWAAESIAVSPRMGSGSTALVSAELEVGGEVLVRPEPNEVGTPGEIEKLPISVAATLQYEERRLRPTAADGMRAARYYDQATAVIKVADGGQSPALADDRRLLLVEENGGRATFSCPAGLLNREQLDLVDVVGNSLLVNGLLPTEPVAEGDTWNLDKSVMAGLLCVDSVAVCEVQSVLEKYNGQFAKVRLAGVVHGMVDGTATEQEVRVVYLFDRRQRQITRLNLAVREKRSIGAVTPGLDVVAKLRLKIDPTETSAHLGDEAVAALSRGKQPTTSALAYESPEQGFRVQYDRQWYVTGQGRDSITMRRISGGDLVAQCTITRLPPKSAGRQTSLEQFQKDIRYSLGERFGQLVSSRQWTNSHGHYCYEVVVRGAVEGLPVEWHYFLVAPESGHRVSVAVTIEGTMVERLAGADRELADALELIPVEERPTNTAARPADDATR